MTVHSVNVRDYLHGKQKAPGTKVLVDRLWPRGIAKADLDYDEWFKTVAPSTELRKWFGHDPDRFKEFSQRYTAELDDSDSEELKKLVDSASQGAVSLLFGAGDRECNHAVVLARWVEEACQGS